MPTPTIPTPTIPTKFLPANNADDSNPDSTPTMSKSKQITKLRTRYNVGNYLSKNV
jgi:hypothetical protein